MYSNASPPVAVPRATPKCMADRLIPTPASAVAGSVVMRKLCTTGDIIQLKQAQIISTLPKTVLELIATGIASLSCQPAQRPTSPI